MLNIDLSGRNVLITGGTKGIGLGAAYSFAQAGAQVFITYRWGSADNDELLSSFEQQQLVPPILVQADVARAEDTATLLDVIAQHSSSGIDTYICNVGVAPRLQTMADYSKRALYRTLDYSSWPLVDYCQQLHARFGSYPRYVVGVSSSGPDHVYPAYDFVAIAKSVLEVMARYLAIRLSDTSIINVVRFGPLATESFEYMFGSDWREKAEARGMLPEKSLSIEECGRSLLALCSGMFDAMRGQVINIDYGWPLRDNLLSHLQNA